MSSSDHKDLLPVAEVQRIDTLVVDSYEPRRSNRVSMDHTPADGDTWHERVTVCEGATATGAPRLMVRSYFRNQRTHQRVWDEPPSGASNIRFASPEMRAKAQANMTELQFTLDMIPPDDNELPPVVQEDSKKEKKNIFKRFTKKKPPPALQVNESQDLNLQRAIARSMADFRGQHESNNDDPVILFDSEGDPILPTSGTAHRTSTGMDEDLELAKALSMSETATKPDTTINIASLSEEEQMLIALEESRIEAEQTTNQKTGGVSLPTQQEDFLGFEIKQDPSGSFVAEEEDLDRKLPAIERQNPFESPPSSPTKISNPFDPYAGTSDPAYVNSTIKPPPVASLALPTTPNSPGPRHEAPPDDEQQPNKPKRNFGSIFRGSGHRKTIEEEAGVV